MRPSGCRRPLSLAWWKISEAKSHGRPPPWHWCLRLPVSRSCPPIPSGSILRGPEGGLLVWQRVEDAVPCPGLGRRPGRRVFFAVRFRRCGRHSPPAPSRDARLFAGCFPESRTTVSWDDYGRVGSSRGGPWAARLDTGRGAAFPAERSPPAIVSSLLPGAPSARHRLLPREQPR